MLCTESLNNYTAWWWLIYKAKICHWDCCCSRLLLLLSIVNGTSNQLIQIPQLETKILHSKIFNVYFSTDFCEA